MQEKGGELVKKLLAFKDKALHRVDEFTKKNPVLTQRALFLQAEKKLNIPAPTIFLAVSSLLVLLAILILSIEGVALLAGFVYPAIGTIRAIHNEDLLQLKFFIKYWLLYNLINNLDSIFPFYWIPFYYVFKLSLILWSFNPRTKGANLVYNTFRPIILPPLGIEPGLPEPPKKKKEVKSEKTYTLKVELAARGLEIPAEPERLDTLCQLRVVPPSSRKAALDEGQWYKTPTNTRSPEDEPDWRHDPQYITLPSLNDNTLEVLVINKMSWKDQPLGKISLGLKGLLLPVSLTLPLMDPNEEGSTVAGELELHLAVEE